MTVARIVISFDLAGASPSEAGARFVAALKQALVDAHLHERLDSADLDAIFSVLPGLREA